MEIRDFQNLINKMYSDKDRKRGSAGTFMWMVEEIGELASAIAEGTQQNKEEEFADVLAWLFSLANVENVNLTAALETKYGSGCPGCGKMACSCSTKD